MPFHTVHGVLKARILKWFSIPFSSGMEEFKLDDHYTYCCGQKSLRRNGVALIVNKRVWNAVLGCNLGKQQNDIGLFPRQTIQHRSNPSLCPSTHFFIEKVYAFFFQRSWSWSVLWKPIRPSRTNTKKEDVLFITGDWNAKVRSQEIPGIKGKFALGVQNEEGQRLTEFCQENALVIGKPSSNNTREDSTHVHH